MDGNTLAETDTHPDHAEGVESIESASPASREYRVELDVYAGPLDLLLYLVRRHEVDLHDIPIATITDQYLEHLKAIQRVDVDRATQFLVMAATLLEIKSAMLIPPPPADPDAEGSTDATALLDPRYELVQQLLAYKQIKDAANALADRRDLWRQRLPHRPGAQPHTDAPQGSIEGEATDDGPAIDLEDADIADLCKAFIRIMDSVGHAPGPHEIVRDDTPLALHAADILDRLERDGPTTLQEIFVGRRNRAEMISLFLATLELVKQRKIRVVQDPTDPSIKLERARDEPEDAESPTELPIETTRQAEVLSEPVH